MTKLLLIHCGVHQSPSMSHFIFQQSPTSQRFWPGWLCWHVSWSLVGTEVRIRLPLHFPNLSVASHSAYENPRRGLPLSVQDWHSQQHSQCPAKSGNHDIQNYTVRIQSGNSCRSRPSQCEFRSPENHRSQASTALEKKKDGDLRRSDSSWSFLLRGGIFRYILTWNQGERHVRTIKADQIMVPSLAFFRISIHVKVRKGSKGKVTNSQCSASFWHVLWPAANKCLCICMYMYVYVQIYDYIYIYVCVYMYISACVW